jgi:5-methylcytosine-specific restriction endonuclease McrA
MANRSIQRDRACRQCGVSPITGYKFCSSECAKNDRGIQPHPCGLCGILTRRPKYCSTACCQAAKPKRDRPSRWHMKAVAQLTCTVCGVGFSRALTPGRDAGICCSRACGFEWIRRNRHTFDTRVRSDKAMYRRWAKRAKAEAGRVQRLCERELRASRVTVLAALVRFVLNPKRPCADCDKPLGCTNRRSVVCEFCRRKRDRAAPSRRADKAYRKALQRGKISGAERFDPLEVLARDGWRCHICGINTPKRFRGTFHKQAPELDHIVPLALGGSHTRLNTACACRACNGKKGAQALGQLRLVA